jgi:hypothetical protein
MIGMLGLLYYDCHDRTACLDREAVDWCVVPATVRTVLVL